jgi:hypothetical protein
MSIPGVLDKVSPNLRTPPKVTTAGRSTRFVLAADPDRTIARAAMNREKALKVLLVLSGLLFVGGVYFIAMYLWRPANQPPGDTIILSLYVTLGIFLFLAVRNPSAHRSLIAYAGWANIAHAGVMVLMAIHPLSDRGPLLTAAAIFGAIGVALVALAPAKQPGPAPSGFSAIRPGPGIMAMSISTPHIEIPGASATTPTAFEETKVQAMLTETSLPPTQNSVSCHGDRSGSVY